MNMNKENQSSAKQFVILGFYAPLNLQLPLFMAFLFVYIIALTANLGILLVIFMGSLLHTPMYFFLSNLSCLDICLVSTTGPTILEALALHGAHISFSGCMAQLYIFLAVGVTEHFLLSAMACDRYMAICNPLRYPLLMNKRACTRLLLGCWISGFVSVMMPTVFISRLPFCGSRIINHAFCDISPLMQLSCSNTYALEKLNFITAAILILGTFFIVVVSYILIIRTICRIPSLTGRSKTFSTCASHFTVVFIYYGTVIFTYVRPNARSSLDLDKVITVFYCAVTPMLNPLIYSFRNQNFKNILKKRLGKKKRDS
ncbi:olfactory receptor 6M1-like [Pleurodeles waltl]|uniref:olfactory receptor 6M1-like n=1 Tax=Pleurodeles waltl TaxID=8319 RepID=UPI003709A332